MPVNSDIENPECSDAESRPSVADDRGAYTPFRAAAKRAEEAEARAIALAAENRRLRAERTSALLSAASSEAASIETACRRAENAETHAATLDTENRQLRSDRTKLALSAAQAETESLESVTLRAEIAEARALALEAENSQLRSERAHAVLAAARAETMLREAGHSPAAPAAGGMAGASAPGDATSSFSAAALEPSRQEELHQRIRALSERVKTADAALLVSEREREATAHSVESTLRRELSRRIDALKRRQADELETQLRAAKRRAAEELMSAMCAANAAWRKETEAKLRDARTRAHAAMARARSAWRLRSRIALFQAARVWRSRERQRLAEAKRKWAAMHREALDACDRRCRAKVARLKARMRRPIWQPALWRRAAERVFTFASSISRPGSRDLRMTAPNRAAAGDVGFVAVILVIMAVYLPPTGPFLSTAPDATAVAAAQAQPQTLLARLRSDEADDVSSTRETPKRQGAASREPNGAGRSSAAAKVPEDDAADDELRRQLLRKIHKLRADLSAR